MAWPVTAPAGDLSYYRCGEAILLRAAALPLTQAPGQWPDLDDSAGCREWLAWAWARTSTSAAIQIASPALARRVEEILAGAPASHRRVRAAAASLVRYLLRETGRPTPFGLFAGVAAASWGGRAHALMGPGHQAVLRCDAEWLAAIIKRCETCPELLERLDVVFSNLALRRGSRLELTRGQQRISIRCTPQVRAVRAEAAAPVRFGILEDRLARSFRAGDPAMARSMLTGLVEQGFLITTLHAPMTATDPVGHLVSRLHAARAGALPAVAPLLADLDAFHRDLLTHDAQTGGQQALPRAGLSDAARRISDAGRTPLCADLLLDCDVRLPASVAAELAGAASALTRLSPNPAGSPVWASFHELFTQRYGAGAIVPVLDVVDPGSGLGFPAGYPGSVLPAPPVGAAPRDERLAALAWRAVTQGQAEIVLTDETIAKVTAGDAFNPCYVQPHVELAASIRAVSCEALDCGDYILAVAPARAAGTLTSRFSLGATGSGLRDVYRRVPALYGGALPVQLSFPPLYMRGENVSRVPAYLDYVLPLGEHRPRRGAEIIIDLDDVAVTATRRGLLLIWLQSGQVIEPQVFHALALDKQVPPMARFLAQLPRAFAADYLAFDWGWPTRLMPYLPQVRYRKTILTPARWRLTDDDLAGPGAGAVPWQEALGRWQADVRCPDHVELHDGDLTLRLDLRVPAHAASLRNHLARRHDAVLTPACDPAQLGWLGGHSHEVAVPLTRLGLPAPSQLAGGRPVVVTGQHGHFPAAPGSRWLTAKLFAHPECIDQIIRAHIPDLIASLGDSPALWFVRYRAPGESDHLRLRVFTGRPQAAGRHAVVIASWADRLRACALTGRLAFDTYYPETGRYGGGAAMNAAESVFAADSLTAISQLTESPPGLDPVGMAALSMLDITEAFLGGMQAAATWLTRRPRPQARAADRKASTAVTRLARKGIPRELRVLPAELGEAMRRRAEALGSYRAALPPGADTSAVLDSLLHLHHNRVLGIDPQREAHVRVLLRQAALAWQSAHPGTPA